MWGPCVGALRRHAGKLLVGLSVALTLAGTLASDDAEARRYRRHHYYRHYHHRYHYHHRHAHYSGRHGGYVPAFSAMVVDANSGRTLYASNENELRHPASITKVMTLYLLFEQLEKGRFSLDTPIRVSDHAAQQAPSKLDLDPGETIAVEDAIKAVVTKSANDIAVAIAEAVGGDEDHFAEMMTNKAHALGMSRTVYRNASGLPDDEQVTTARDLTILGRAIQERFPKYYRYFSTHSFAYGGAVYRNHNHLLGRIEGIDGIKTGYTRGSGFNLLTSARRGSHHIVSVVLGGRTAGERDRQMAALVENNIDAGSGLHTASMIAEAEPTEAPQRVAAAEPARTLPPPIPAPAPIARSAAPVEIAPVQTAALALAPKAPERPRIALFSAPQATQPGPLVATRPAPPPRPTDLATTTPRRLQPPEDVPATAAIPLPPRRLAAADSGRSEAVRTVVIPSGAMMIQIGASDNMEKASELLERAQARSHGVLDAAQPFTQKVQKGEMTLYRARFAGLDPSAAEAACKSLLRSGFDCFTTKN
jgi:D-alanyl-D-alanine carboxypeptidase